MVVLDGSGISMEIPSEHKNLLERVIKLLEGIDLKLEKIEGNIQNFMQTQTEKKKKVKAYDSNGKPLTIYIFQSP